MKSEKTVREKWLVRIFGSIAVFMFITGLTRPYGLSLAMGYFAIGTGFGMIFVALNPDWLSMQINRENLVASHSVSGISSIVLRVLSMLFFALGLVQAIFR